MLKARDAKYSVPIRYGKVLFCGAAAAGKSNFLHLLMKEDFQELHISTEVLKPQQVTVAMKAVISSSEGEVEFTKMNIDEEILQLESYLPQPRLESHLPQPQLESHLPQPQLESHLPQPQLESHLPQPQLESHLPQPQLESHLPQPQLESHLPQPHYASIMFSSDDKLDFDTDVEIQSPFPKLEDNPSTDNLPEGYTTYIEEPLQKHSPQNPSPYLEDNSSAKKAKLTFANVKTGVKKLKLKGPEQVWDILTFMDTGGQPQFISMLPAVNSFAMITFVIHKMEPGGQSSLDKIVEVQYGNEKGKVSHELHHHKYTYIQLIETLISYASNILQPDTTFLDKVKTESKEYEHTRSIVLAGTHSGDDQLSEDDIKNIDEELTKIVQKSGINYIKPQLNKSYNFLVPVDNKKQGKNSELQVTAEDAKRYTDPSDICRYIHRFLNYQNEIHVPIKWILLELEIRKVCQQKNCNLISYHDVLKLANEKNFGYNGEFGDDVNIDGEKFIKQGLRFHHSFGVLLYFEDVEGMQKLVITNHQWLFNKLSKIVEYSFTCDTVEEMEDLKNGIFKKTLLASDILDISKDFKDSQIDITSVDPINAFLNLLEYLRIAATLNESRVKYFMPCLLDSCELTNLNKMVPGYKANNIEPLLVQFKSKDNKTYSFPRGAFCFLVVELMVSMKWEPYRQAYVNLITLFKKDTAHYVTLIDRIFCLEVHITYKNNKNVHDKVREIIDNALCNIGKKLKMDCSLCHGFTCSCQLIKEVHISYLNDDNEHYSYCKKKSTTDLTDSHKVWLKTYFKVWLYECECLL